MPKRVIGQLWCAVTAACVVYDLTHGVSAGWVAIAVFATVLNAFTGLGL